MSSNEKHKTVKICTCRLMIVTNDAFGCNFVFWESQLVRSFGSNERYQFQFQFQFQFFQQTQLVDTSCFLVAFHQRFNITSQVKITLICF